MPLGGYLIAALRFYDDGHTCEPDEGNALLCCCTPKGDADVVVDA